MYLYVCLCFVREYVHVFVFCERLCMLVFVCLDVFGERLCVCK